MRPLAAVLCAVLGLSACTGADRTADDPAPATEETRTSQEPPRPRTGECHRLSPRDLLESADTRPVVRCAGRHTSETVYVGTFGPVARGDAAALTSDRVNRGAARVCLDRAASYLGTRVARLRLTRFGVFWFVPTPEQVEAGADWLRCDVVVLRRGDALLPLPRTLEGALRRPAGIERYGLCGTARPGSQGFERVVCSERHSWRAIATIPIAGGRRYPGPAVRSLGERACRARARAAQGGALQYSHGWEWPTAAQWEAGQRHGYCWAPA